jgi:hypothetical protein
MIEEEDHTVDFDIIMHSDKPTQTKHSFDKPDLSENNRTGSTLDAARDVRTSLQRPQKVLSGFYFDDEDCSEEAIVDGGFELTKASPSRDDSITAFLSTIDSYDSQVRKQRQAKVPNQSVEEKHHIDVSS